MINGIPMIGLWFRHPVTMADFLMPESQRTIISITYFLKVLVELQEYISATTAISSSKLQAGFSCCMSGEQRFFYVSAPQNDTTSAMGHKHTHTHTHTHIY